MHVGEARASRSEHRAAHHALRGTAGRSAGLSRQVSRAPEMIEDLPALLVETWAHLPFDVQRLQHAGHLELVIALGDFVDRRLELLGLGAHADLPSPPDL